MAAVGGLLLIIATLWDGLGEGGRREGMTGYDPAPGRVRERPVNGTVLVRAPSSRLAEGIVTHISRAPVDVALASAQHAGYADALAASGWTIRQVPAAEDCPDSVFIED